MLAAPIDKLVERLGASWTGPTFGSIHVQTDVKGAVELAVQKALPRLGRSKGTTVSGPHNGWGAVHDELCDRDPKVLQRLAEKPSHAIRGGLARPRARGAAGGGRPAFRPRGGGGRGAGPPGELR